MQSKSIISLMSLLLLLSLTGCASISDRWHNPGTCVKNKCRAHHAWCKWCWCYDDVDHRHHFGKGFRAGYRDVLEGGKGCQPTLPPRCYWKSCYQTCEGREKVNAWFDGFSHGALAAQQDGVANWNQIPLSPTARMNLRMAGAPPQPTHWGTNGLPTPMAAPPPPPAGAPPLILHQPPTMNDDDDDDGLDEIDLDELGIEAEDEAFPLRPYE